MKMKFKKLEWEKGYCFEMLLEWEYGIIQV